MKRANQVTLFSLIISLVSGGYLPDLNIGYQYIEGDLLLGGIFPLADDCNARKVTNFGLVMLAEAMPFAVQEINARSDILPNTTLGYVIFDSCFSDRNTLAQSLYMVPDKNPKSDCTVYRETCANPYFDVVGVVGPHTSAGAVLQSHLLSFFHIPQISAYATSDALSVNERHPYFLRTVPPDRWQILALGELIKHFNWTYLSAVRQAGSYGDGIELVRKCVEPYGVCFAAVKTISTKSTQSEVDEIVTALVAEKNARVVIFYCLFEQALAVMEAMDKRGVLGDFALVGSDGLGMLVQNTKNSIKASLTHGLLVVTQYSNSVPKFDDYFKQLSTVDVNGSIILEQFWEYKFNCKMSGSNNKCSTGLKLTENEGFFSYRPASMVIDAVYSFAHALHGLIQAECPNTTPDKTRECIKGNTLLGYLKNVSFDGRLGKVQFDQNGDIMGKYEVRNVYFENGHFDSRRVAELDTATETLTVDTNLIQWHTNFSNYVEGSDKIPESVCSKPCAAGYHRIHMLNKCCWSCRKCRPNEITNSSETECIQCAIFEWPDQRTFRKCIEIEPDFIKWTSSLAIVMAILALIGIIICLVVMVLFYKTKSDKLIKASSIELMYLILTGSTLGHVIVFTFLARPSVLICYVQHFGFNITFTITYCPLLAKTRRIYAIFMSGRKSKVPPRFIHLTAQIVICGTLIGIQIILTVLSAILEKPQPMKYMPNETKPYVELGCTLPRWGLIASLGYNVCLVLACTFYAVKAREVPQNFNETRFISFSVYTTLILWLAFIPTYFTASSEFSKVLFLIVAIIVNSYVVLIMLFVPKLYAVFYVSDDDLKFLQSQIGPDGLRSRTPSAASRISSPVPSRFTSPAHPNGRLEDTGISSIA